MTPQSFEVVITDGAEPDDPDPMVVTDDDDQPLRFDSEQAASDWSWANYPQWLIDHHGNGHHWKSLGFSVRPVVEPSCSTCGGDVDDQGRCQQTCEAGSGAW